MSGLRVAAEIRKMKPDMPVALCSGHVSEELKQQAIQVGINKVLYKPNTMEELSGVIHQLAVGRQ
jgi:CheY-like chemotaxis protein